MRPACAARSLVEIAPPATAMATVAARATAMIAALRDSDIALSLSNAGVARQWTMLPQIMDDITAFLCG